MSLKIEAHEFYDGNFMHGLFDSTNKINIGDSDYLFIIPFGYNLPQQFTDTELNDTSLDTVYLFKIPFGHRLAFRDQINCYDPENESVMIL